MDDDANPYLITQTDERAEIAEFLKRIEAQIEDLDGDDDDFPQVLNTIMQEMHDDDDALRQNEKLVWWYLNADWLERAWIDRVLAFVCGWTVPTLLHIARGEVETEVPRIGIDGETTTYQSIWTKADHPAKIALDAAYEEADKLKPDWDAFRAARAAAQCIFDRSI